MPSYQGWVDGGSCYNQTSCAYPDPGFTPVENAAQYQLFPVRDSENELQPDRRAGALPGARFMASVPGDVYAGNIQIRLSVSTLFDVPQLSLDVV